MIKITVDTVVIIEEHNMVKEGSKKVTIDVPIEKYELLEEIKNAGGINSIRAGVSEGVDLVILNHIELLEENIVTRVDNLRDSLSKIKKEHSE